jgi:hypothetical protein
MGNFAKYNASLNIESRKGIITLGYETIIYKKSGQVGIITLNRPTKKMR